MTLQPCVVAQVACLELLKVLDASSKALANHKPGSEDKGVGNDHASKGEAEAEVSSSLPAGHVDTSAQWDAKTPREDLALFVGALKACPSINNTVMARRFAFAELLEGSGSRTDPTAARADLVAREAARAASRAAAAERFKADALLEAQHKQVSHCGP